MARATKTSDCLPAGSEAHQRLVWRIERIVWGLWLAIIIAALGGAFGAGALVHTSAGNEAVTVLYDRVMRAGAPASLRFRIRDASAPLLSLRVGQAYLGRVSVTSYLPEPQRVALAADGLVLEFPVAEPGAAVEILFRLEPESYGVVTGTFAVGGGAPITIRQLVLP